MFKLLEDNTLYYLYQAEFDNPVIISYNGNNILLTNKCVIYNTSPTGIILRTNVTDITYKPQKYTFDIEYEYCIYLKTNNTVDKNLRLHLKILRDTVKEINQAIEDTYKPGGEMYKKSQTLIESFSTETL